MNYSFSHGIGIIEYNNERFLINKLSLFIQAIEKDEKEAQNWIDEELKDINYNKYQEEV